MKHFMAVLIAAGGLSALPASADEAQLEQKVKKGGVGVWGQIPMPPNAAVPDADIRKLVDWILKTG